MNDEADSHMYKLMFDKTDVWYFLTLRSWMMEKIFLNL